MSVGNKISRKERGSRRSGDHIEKPHGLLSREKKEEREGKSKPSLFCLRRLRPSSLWQRLHLDQILKSSDTSATIEEKRKYHSALSLKGSERKLGSLD